MGWVVDDFRSLGLQPRVRGSGPSLADHRPRTSGDTQAHLSFTRSRRDQARSGRHPRRNPPRTGHGRTPVHRRIGLHAVQLPFDRRWPLRSSSMHVQQLRVELNQALRSVPKAARCKLSMPKRPEGISPAVSPKRSALFRTQTVDSHVTPAQ